MKRDEDETRHALAQKEHQTKETWREVCTIPDSLGRGSFADIYTSRVDDATGGDGDINEENDGRSSDDTDLPTGTR